jgi:type III secretion protein C
MKKINYTLFLIALGFFLVPDFLISVPLQSPSSYSSTALSSIGQAVAQEDFQGPSPGIAPAPPARAFPVRSDDRPPDFEQNPGSNSSGFLINFNNVGIVEYIRFVSKISNKNFIFDAADLNFSVTIVSEEPTTMQDIMAALVQELRIHGLSLLEQGNSFVIHRNPAVSNISQVITDKQDIPLYEQMELVTQVFHLNTLDPERTAAIIRPMISVQALVESSQETGHLIVTDIKTNVAKIAELIQNLDSPASGFEIGQYVARNTRIDALIALAHRIMEPIANGKSLTFVPHAKNNSVFIISNPYLVERTVALLQSLDISEQKTGLLSLDDLKIGKEALKPSGNLGENLPPQPIPPEEWSSDLPPEHIENTQFFLYKLQYRGGEQIEKALRKVAESLLLSGNKNHDLISAIDSIQWIETSNALLFTGSPPALKRARELLTQIDVPLRQVFIEVLIIDTTVDNSLNFGVEWATRFGGPDSGGSQSFLNRLVSPLPPAMDAAITVPLADSTPTLNPGQFVDLANPGLGRGTPGYNLGIIGRNIRFGNMSFDTIGALITAVHSDQNTTIVMNPKIIVEDNIPAEIFVGQNIGFVGQTVVNDQGRILTTNFNYRDIGALFRVTPYLASDNVITLDIDQEVSSVVGPIPTQTNSDPAPITTNKSHTRTRVHMPDNFFVIISGMMSDTDTKFKTQIPCLGGLPGVGGLFKDNKHRDQKRNLILFLRPHIVDTQQELNHITKRSQGIYTEKNREPNDWNQEVDEGLQFLNLKCNEAY